MGTDFVGDFVGAFTTVCEMVIDVVSDTVSGALALGGTEPLGTRKGKIPPTDTLGIGGILIVDAGVVFGFGLDLFPPPLPVLLFFGSGSP